MKKVIVSSLKDYLYPMKKVLATLKDKKEGKTIIIPNDNKIVKFNDFIKNVDTNNLVKLVHV